MNAIQNLIEIDFSVWVISLFMILSAIIAVYEIISKICAILGKPIGVLKQREADHELLMKTVQDLTSLHDKHEQDTKQSIRHDQMIREDLKTLTDTVNSIATNLDDMKKKNNETKVKELKDDIIRYYNKYRKVGEWTQLEKDAFWDLFADYESRGGDGFVHSIVEPVMRELKEID